ncbi:hypothetical protein [uncultured Dokdonia sp.]|uniref:SecDF P1 head subdomain-containing protein n=1 Tax=uncultured Dokdonia sp. TaxID=575653 RepID=UPI00261DC5ED|nr:hypothetical protein [uncultured Dokdonia sp.]
MSNQPKYEYTIQVTSDAIEDVTITRLKERLETISRVVNINKKNAKEITINFKSDASDTIVQEIITTKGNLAFYETKNLADVGSVIQEVSKMYAADSTESQPLFEDVFYIVPVFESPELGYVKVEDTAAINKLLMKPEIRSHLNERPLHIQFAWGLFDSQTERLPLYALEVGTRKRPAMTGDIVSMARTSRSYDGRPSISINMEALQAEKWERLTRKASQEGFSIAIVVDNQVMMAARAATAIKGGMTEISGNLTEKEAFALSAILNSGPIQQLEIVSIDKQTF